MKISELKKIISNLEDDDDVCAQVNLKGLDGCVPSDDITGVIGGGIDEQSQIRAFELILKIEIDTTEVFSDSIDLPF